MPISPVVVSWPANINTTEGDDVVVIERIDGVGGQSAHQVVAGAAAPIGDELSEDVVELGEAATHRFRVERNKDLEQRPDLG